MLVGRWVMRTAESAVLTPCPPGPEERKTSMRRSSSRISTSTSSTSGTTDTDAKLVCRRLEASNGEMRMSRWTPASPLEVAVGVLAGHLDRDGLDARFLAGEQVDHLGLEARALTPAQVHPHEHLGPVLGLGAAGPGVDGHDARPARRAEPDSITFSSNSSSSRRSRPTPSVISASRLPSSPASWASSSRTARSEAWVVSWPTRSTVRDSSVRSRISSWARRLSSQNAGAAISVSSAASRCSLAGRSKMPPELVHAPGQLARHRASARRACAPPTGHAAPRRRRGRVRPRRSSPRAG